MSGGTGFYGSNQFFRERGLVRAHIGPRLAWHYAMPYPRSDLGTLYGCRKVFDNLRPKLDTGLKPLGWSLSGSNADGVSSINAPAVGATRKPLRDKCVQ